MDFFMPAERVLYDRSYYFSDEAVDDYNEYIADRDGVNVDVVSSLDFFMNEVWKEIDYAIDNGLTAGLVTDDLDSIKSLVARCPAWIECLPSYSAKAAKGVDDVVQAVKTYRANAKRAFRESIPGRIPECLFEGARAAASKTAGGADIGTGPHI